MGGSMTKDFTRPSWQLPGQHRMGRRSSASWEHNFSEINISGKYLDLLQSRINWMAFLGKSRVQSKRDCIKKLESIKECVTGTVEAIYQKNRTGSLKAGPPFIYHS